MDMNLPQECLDRWKNLFLQQIEKHCILYSTIGTSTDESPMWFQYRGIKWDKDVYKRSFCFMFGSSQRMAMTFSIPLDDDEWDLYCYEGIFFRDLYNHFRDAKYDYIKTFHPTIYSELK